MNPLGLNVNYSREREREIKFLMAWVSIANENDEKLFEIKEMTTQSVRLQLSKNQNLNLCLLIPGKFFSVNIFHKKEKNNLPLGNTKRWMQTEKWMMMMMMMMIKKDDNQTDIQIKIVHQTELKKIFLFHLHHFPPSTAWCKSLTFS